MNMKAADRPGRINALQGLRACSFLAIFFSHSVDGYASFGAAGVSVFLILSGFLLAYRYLPRESASSPTLRGNLRFALQKVSVLYPLHLLTLALTLAWMLLNPKQNAQALEHLPLKTALNLLLLQSWFPKSSVYFSLNSVSWYLSTALFTYFLFPWLLQYLRRLIGKKQAIQSLLFLFGLEVLLSLFFGMWGNRNSAAWLSLHWITYVCPIFRTLDFVIGAFAGYLFLVCSNGKVHGMHRSLLASLGEALLVLILFVFCRLYYKIPDQFRYSAVYILPTLLLIVSLAGNGSLFSRILSQKPFLWAGKLSGPAFLIHMPVIRIGRDFLNTRLSNLPWYCSVFLLLLTTLLLSSLWIRLQNRLRSRQTP